MNTYETLRYEPLQKEATKFFNNLEKNLNISYNKDDADNIIEANAKIANILNFINEIWIEMMYCGDNKVYYDKFASKYGETELLKESDYITFDLGDYSVCTLFGNHRRTWLYECEIDKVLKTLRYKKSEIETHIRQFEVRAPATLAFT